jgi:quinol monooxygenase YgiN
MIVSVAMLSVRKGHQAQVVDILNEYVTREKKVAGCVKAYYKQALDNDDTFLVYIEYDNLEHFRAAEKISHHQKKGEKAEFILRPHLLKGFFGNFN